MTYTELCARFLGFRSPPDKSNSAKHMRSNGNSFDSKLSVRLLHCTGNGMKLTALENKEIKKALNNSHATIVINEVSPPRL